MVMVQEWNFTWPLLSPGATLGRILEETYYSVIDIWSGNSKSCKKIKHSCTVYSVHKSYNPLVIVHRCTRAKYYKGKSKKKSKHTTKSTRSCSFQIC